MTKGRMARGIAGMMLLGLVAGCGDGAARSGGDDGEPVDVTATATAEGELAELRTAREELEGVTPASLVADRALPFAEGVDFDPTTAEHIDLVQGSVLALNDAELAALGQRGFAISERHRFPSMVHGYEVIYQQDLPVYITVDSVLEAVHRSYDDILKGIEESALRPELLELLHGMRDGLRTASLPDTVRADIDVFLTVAASLARGELLAPVANGSGAQIGELFSLAEAASGQTDVELFGAQRTIDASQFEPRGHYTDSLALKRYFRAMMWLGRIDLRLLETQPDGRQVFHRRQVEAAVAMRQIMGADALQKHAAIDAVIEAFVGEPDFMTFAGVDALMDGLGVGNLRDLDAIGDQELAQAIVDGGYGAQRISSHIMINDMPEGTLPLSRSFAFMGQRYVVDSHVFSNVVYDRVAGGTVRRMMPDPLDVAYAALDNDQAVALLEPELQQYDYATELEWTHLLVEEHGPSYWESNIYNLWLGALRSLSPTAEQLTDPSLPTVARTEAWGRRLLNAQLASWAQLRHDTILYAKQSYTGGITCEFPDAYVDPYPEVFAAVRRLAEHAANLLAELPLETTDQQGYFAELATTAGMLEEMARHVRDGTPFTAEQLAFVNDMVRIQEICGAVYAEGWYARMFYDDGHAAEYDPTIADVHTQPTDEHGNQVGRVLHVGTGMPRLMAVTVDTCTGPRAYVGPVFSYFERITENYERLTDDVWAEELNGATPEDVAFMQDLVVR